MSEEGELTDEPADPDLGKPVKMDDDVDGFEKATVRDLRERVDDLEQRVEELEDLCRMAAERLREQREQNDRTEERPK